MHAQVYNIRFARTYKEIHTIQQSTEPAQHKARMACVCVVVKARRTLITVIIVQNVAAQFGRVRFDNLLFFIELNRKMLRIFFLKLMKTHHQLRTKRRRRRKGKKCAGGKADEEVEAATTKCYMSIERIHTCNVYHNLFNYRPFARLNMYHLMFASFFAPIFRFSFVCALVRLLGGLFSSCSLLLLV